MTVCGWQTHHTPSHSNDWDGGLWHKTPLLRTGRHFLHGGAGAQRWDFPSVKCGTQHRLSAVNLTYQTKAGPFPVTVLRDSRTLHVLALPKGTLLHSQAYTRHRLYRLGELQILFRHGPRHTYSWKFCAANGAPRGALHGGREDYIRRSSSD